MRKSVKEELKKMSLEELKKHAQEIRHEIFSLKMKKMSAPVKDVMLVKKLKKTLACTLTFLQQGVTHGK